MQTTLDEPQALFLLCYNLQFSVLHKQEVSYSLIEYQRGPIWGKCPERTFAAVFQIVHSRSSASPAFFKIIGHYLQIWMHTLMKQKHNMIYSQAHLLQ